ncbi:MAG: autotransporter-associated beta strand repeat-containing protein, partial [Verrucomicrobia bacterium]|nr:autotransporter-associated beta strand repeat-containing protein [Verrucomicrobiota bacterium]
MKITAQILAGSIATLVLATHSAQATSAAWNVNADGAWVTDSNWSPAAAPGAVSGNTSTDVATFSNAITLFGKTITVDANRNIGGISFGNTSSFGFTLTGGNLLLSNAGVIQSLAADGGHMETIASAIAIQGDGGSASFSALSTSTSNHLNIAGGVTGVSTAGNTTTLNLNGTNTGGNVITGIIGDGSLGGKLALTKSAAGTWQLNGANTYTGTTTLTLGTLVVDHASALGVGGNITFGGGTLQYTATSAGQDWSTRFKNTTAGGILLNTNGSDVTLAGVIDSSNTAGLTKSGGATLTLSGANTYTGVTTIGGTVMSVLRLNDASALGGGGNLTFTGGRLQYTANNTVDYSARIVGSTGAITIDTNGQNVSFGSVLASTNTNGIYKMGTGDLTFGGNISHLYTGNTSLNGGRLILDNTGAGNNNANRITDGSGLTVNNGTFLYKGSDQAATNSTETLGGFNVGTGTLTVAFGGT